MKNFNPLDKYCHDAKPMLQDVLPSVFVTVGLYSKKFILCVDFNGYPLTLYFSFNSTLYFQSDFRLKVTQNRVAMYTCPSDDS